MIGIQRPPASLELQGCNRRLTENIGVFVWYNPKLVAIGALHVSSWSRRWLNRQSADLEKEHYEFQNQCAISAFAAQHDSGAAGHAGGGIPSGGVQVGVGQGVS